MRQFRQALAQKYPDMVLGHVAPDAGMHVAPVNDADVDPAESLVVTGSNDRTARVWRLADGRLIHVLRIPGVGTVGQIYAVTMSPDGQLVALGGWEGNVYLFRTADWRLVGTIGGMASIVSMRFSPDGKRLAVGLYGSNGVRVFDTERYGAVFSDHDYSDSCYGLAFSKTGYLAVASWDRTVRLYGPDHAPLAKHHFEQRPHRLAFDPGGEMVAVGFLDKPVVRLLRSPGLDVVLEAGVAQRDPTDSFGTVAWSSDGSEFYGSGRYDDEEGYNVIVGWRRDGTKVSEWRLNTNTTDRIIALAKGGLVVAAQDPLVGILTDEGKPRWVQRAHIADFRGQVSEFRFSADLSIVQFAWRAADRDLLTFDLRALGFVDRPRVPLRAAVTTAPGFVVARWKSLTGPTLNGRPLSVEAFEPCRALSIDPAHDRFILGCEWHVYEFDGSGQLLWKRGFGASARAISFSDDGRLALLAMEDGTLRWLAAEDGRLVVSLFVYEEGRDWVAWTPEGFLAGSPFGESLLGIHVLRRDGATDLVPMLDFAQLMRRPDIVARALDSLPSH